MHPPLSVCIVSHNAYGALSANGIGHIGGVEWQTSLTAKWLAAQGHRVSIVTWDEGQPANQTIAGVRTIRLCRKAAGIRGLRFFAPRWTSLVRALQEADADVYYHNGAEYVTGQVAMWCRRNQRGFVFSAANDPDVDGALPDLKSRRERLLYRYGLRQADRIIVQTLRQQSMLNQGFGHDSVVIPMPCPGPSETEYAERAPTPGTPGPVLWVARICRQKRPDRLMELARACPDVPFAFVGPVANNEYTQQVLRTAEQLPNVSVHGRVAREHMPEFYRTASCLCCTSDFEGFPNTFLEAWSHGLPIVSTFDPDNVIATRGLGYVASDVASLAMGIRRLLNSPDEWRTASIRARQYYSENHTVESILPRFEQIFREVAERAARARGRA